MGEEVKKDTGINQMVAGTELHFGHHGALGFTCDESKHPIKDSEFDLGNSEIAIAPNKRQAITEYRLYIKGKHFRPVIATIDFHKVHDLYLELCYAYYMLRLGEYDFVRVINLPKRNLEGLLNRGTDEWPNPHDIQTTNGVFLFELESNGMLQDIMVYLAQLRINDELWTVKAIDENTPRYSPKEIEAVFELFYYEGI
jgi:hypothetical protein